MSDPGKAVFLSYASQDAEAARKLCETLRAAGVEVWFDTDGGLEHGDEWDAKIRRQIKECVLFLPLISASTQAREEGYFRIEWDLAAERARGIASGVAFILPVVIDDTKEPGALVPDRFRSVQWTRLPGGNVPPDVLQRFLKLWSHRAGVVKHESREPRAEIPEQEWEAGRPRPAASGPKWLRPILASAAIVIAVLAYTLITRRAPERPIVPPPVPAPTPAPVAPPVSPARELVAKAYPLFQGLEATREDYALAEEYCQRALKLDPDDGEVWAAYAQLHSAFGYRGWDTSPERREQNRVMAERAIRLAPNSPQAKMAQAGAWSAFGINRAETEKLLREVVAAEPANQVALRFLAVTVLNQGKLDECLALNERSAALPGGDPLALFNSGRYLWQRGRRAEAYALLQRSLAQKPFSSSLTLMTIMEIVWRGDVAAAEATLKQIPQSALLEDRANYTAGLLRYYQRRPDEALEAWGAFPRDYYVDFAYDGPKGLIVGLAHEMAQRDAAAKIEWRTALQAVEKRIAATPNKPAPYYYQAYLLACLGEKAAAAEALRTCEQLSGIKYTTGAEMTFELALIYARLGRFDEIFAQSPERFIGRLRVDPRFDLLRTDPRFQQLLATAATPAKSQTPDPGPAEQPTVNQKSVAVLAFANLSDDKANEYFSDGISEELLNVLAKIPGLKVSARTSAFYFKGKEVPIPEIAKQLGVAYVVEGSVRKSADRVRITAELIKAADGFQVWSDTFTRDVRDIFAVQDEIAGLIAENLKLKMGDIPRVTRTVNPEAHRLVLEGRHFWNLRTTEGFARAEAAFTGAIELDPQFAEAHAGLADNFQIRAQYKMLDGVGGEAVDQERAWTEGQIAFRLDPSLPETNAALAYLLHNQGKLVEAEGYYKKAFALNPNYATAHLWHGQWLDAYGRLDAAIAENRLACDLDPLGFIILDRYAQHLALARRYQEALAMNERAAALRTDLWMPNVGERALILFALGRNKEAVEAARAVRQNPTSWPRWTADADALWVLSQSGLAEEAGAYAAELLQKLAEKSYVRGFVLIYTGRFDEAMPYLERSPVLMRRPLFWDPRLDQWREDPRFHQLLAKLSCAEEYKVARDTLARMLKDQTTKK